MQSAFVCVFAFRHALKIAAVSPAVTSRLAVVLTFAQLRSPDFRAVPSRTLRPLVTSPIRDSADEEFRAVSPAVTPLIWQVSLQYESAHRTRLAGPLLPDTRVNWLQSGRA